jgi:hypothetical protein
MVKKPTWNNSKKITINRSQEFFLNIPAVVQNCGL